MSVYVDMVGKVIDSTLRESNFLDIANLVAL